MPTLRSDRFAIPEEAEGLDPGGLYTSRKYGEQGSLLRDTPQEARVTLRGDARGVGLYEGIAPEEGFAPIERTIAYQRSVEEPQPEGAEDPLTGVEGGGEGGLPGIDEPGYAKAKWGETMDEYNAQISERDTITKRGAAMGASVKAIEQALKRRGLDKLKEPTPPEWLVKMAQGKAPTPTSLKGGIMERHLEGEDLTETEQAYLPQDPYYDKAATYLKSDYDFQDADIPGKVRMIKEMAEQLRSGGGGVEPSRAEGLVPEELQTLNDILIEAGGDYERARQIARERGISFGG